MGKEITLVKCPECGSVYDLRMTRTDTYVQNGTGEWVLQGGGDDYETVECMACDWSGNYLETISIKEPKENLS
jgi:ssDNA-binding Zn-finger/Zn-ribbon topoisomerase 1